MGSFSGSAKVDNQYRPLYDNLFAQFETARKTSLARVGAIPAEGGTPKQKLLLQHASTLNQYLSSATRVLSEIFSTKDVDLRRERWQNLIDRLHGLKPALTPPSLEVPAVPPPTPSPVMATTTPAPAPAATRSFAPPATPGGHGHHAHAPVRGASVGG